MNKTKHSQKKYYKAKVRKEFNIFLSENIFKKTFFFYCLLFVFVFFFSKFKLPQRIQVRLFLLNVIYNE